MGASINSESTTALEWTSAEATWGVNEFNWRQIFAPDSAVVNTQKSVELAWRQCIIKEKQSNQINTLWCKGSRHTDSLG